MADEEILRSPSGRPLLWSERKRLAETGSLGDLVSDKVPATVRGAIMALFARPHHKSREFQADLRHRCRVRFGVPEDVALGLGLDGPLDNFLDFIELFVEAAKVPYAIDTMGLASVTPFDDPERTITGVFELHRFGFVVENGQVRPVVSPALEVEVVGPALLAARQAGWEKVERSYREALGDLRGGKIGDALREANNAVESALKAMGLKGNDLTPLLKSLRNSGLLAGYVNEAPKAVTDLIQRLVAWRSQGDPHGKGPDAPEPPRELAALAVHWAGAVIVYLAEVARQET